MFWEENSCFFCMFCLLFGMFSALFVHVVMLCCSKKDIPLWFAKEASRVKYFYRHPLGRSDGIYNNLYASPIISAKGHNKRRKQVIIYLSNNTAKIQKIFELCKENRHYFSIIFCYFVK